MSRTITIQSREKEVTYELASFGQRLLARVIDVCIIIIPNMIIPVVPSWIYWAIQQSGKSQATVGQKAAGIKVIDVNGDNVSFGQASGRFFGNFLNIITFFLGYFMFFFNDQNQCLHDYISNCVVVKEKELKNTEIQTNESKQNLNEGFKTDDNTSAVSESIIKEYEAKVPEYLIELWKSNGFGKYSSGLIALVNPKDFEPSLWTWLGGAFENYIPFAISGFGELFYYRKLTETDEDVCMIDIQYRKIETIAWSLESFFTDFLTNEEDREQRLRETLFKKAIAEQGNLEKNEVFTVTPVLAMGGAMETKYLKKGNAQVYQDIVFQMTM